MLVIDAGPQGVPAVSRFKRTALVNVDELRSCEAVTGKSPGLGMSSASALRNEAIASTVVRELIVCSHPVEKDTSRAFAVDPVRARAVIEDSRSRTTIVR